jgi:hypothetical protein
MALTPLATCGARSRRVSKPGGVSWLLTAVEMFEAQLRRHREPVRGHELFGEVFVVHENAAHGWGTSSLSTAQVVAYPVDPAAGW